MTSTVGLTNGMFPRGSAQRESGDAPALLVMQLSLKSVRWLPDWVARRQGSVSYVTQALICKGLTFLHV